MKHLLLLLLALFLLTLPCNANFTMSQHYVVGNGLSNNFTHGIVQDAKGRIWIATESGLNCYDGYSFSSYMTYNSKLRSNYVNTLFYDEKHGLVWLGVKGYGVYVIDEKSGEISDVTPHDMVLYNVMSISASSDDGVWLVSNNKIVHYSYRDKTFSLFLASKRKEAYRMAADDGQGHLYIARYDVGLDVMNIKSRKIDNSYSWEGTIKVEYIYKFFLDSNRKMWIATNAGVRVLDCVTHRLRYFHELGSDAVFDIKQYGKMKLVATNNQVKMIEPTVMKVVFSKPVGNVWRIYVDKYKNLWLSTSSDGIYFWGITQSPFINVLPRSVWCLTPDGKKMWMGDMIEFI